MGQGASRRKGGRRSYLKRYSSTIVGGTSNIDKHYFREANQRAHALSHKDIAFMNLFGLSDPSKTDGLARDAYGMERRLSLNSPREVVLRQLNTFTQGVDPTHNVCIIPLQVYMIWDDHGFYSFIRYDRGRESIQRSFRYSSRDSAMTAFRTQSIKWKPAS